MNHLDVAVERAVRTGTNQMALRMTEQMMDDLGAEYVETSAHMGARPTHAEWQGQVFHVGGDTDEYPDFEDSTGYGDVTGLGGANCRHSYFPFFPGISTRAYTDSQLDNIDPPPFEYKGKSYTYYEAAQAQRGLERDMRKIKRELVGLDEAGKSVAELGMDFQNASIKLQMKKQAYIDFTNSANAAYKTFPGARLPYRMDNAQVWRFGHRTAGKALWAGKMPAVPKGAARTKISNVASQATPSVPISIKIDMGTQAVQLSDVAYFLDVEKKLAGAPESVKRAWNNIVNDVKVLDTNWTGTAHYTPAGRGIKFDLAADKTERTTVKYVNGQLTKVLLDPAHSTYFHETWHNVSAVAARKSGGAAQDFADVFKSKKHTKTYSQWAPNGSQVSITEGYTLTEMIEKEAKDYIDKVWRDLKGEAISNGLKANTVSKRDAYNFIKSEMSGLSTDAQSDISDMWEGATKGKVSTVMGHGTAYWTYHTVGTEGFAEMAKATINHPASLSAIKKYFPKAYDIWLEMIDAIGVL
jgi:hypothetical protein